MPHISVIISAKNNSDYIYYSKFKEIGGDHSNSAIESSSKNGQNSNNDKVSRRKYSRKTANEGTNGCNGKSSKSNSFHVPRPSQKPISEKLVEQTYPQSCEEVVCDVSARSITSNSGNMGISAVDLNSDPNNKRAEMTA